MSEDQKDLEPKKAAPSASKAEKPSAPRPVGLAEANRMAARVQRPHRPETQESRRARLEDEERKLGQKLAEARAEARNVLAEARVEADRLVDSARAQAKQVREAANAEADAIVGAASAKAAEAKGKPHPKGVKGKPAAKRADAPKGEA